MTVVLVVGGARSGKSAVAERLAAAHRAVTYVATAQRIDGDADWDSRIAAHRAARPETWTTVEVDAAGLAPCLRDTHGAVLVDSLGTWVAAHPDLEVDEAPLVAALAARRSDGRPTVVVSDEVGLGVHPETEVGRRFRDVVGRVNQAVGAIADEVVLVVAGRTLTLR